jgi:ATP-dependent RNA helicase RhlE
MSFDQYAIHPKCLNVLERQRITEPTPVQAESIPVALEGRDVISVAQTGTGKTLAFSLPAVTRLAKGKRGRTRMLVLTPTRELAQQVDKVIAPMAKAIGLRTICVFGGVGMHPQTRALRAGTDIVIATPGRLLDHINRGNARLDSVSILVLDEADRMLDMGFMPDMRRIIGTLPEERQTLLFSATFPKEIRHLAADFQKDPKRIEVGPTSKPVDTVRQGLYTVDPHEKTQLLSTILGEPEVKSTIVFLRTKFRTEKIAKVLNKKGIRAQAIHGGRTQSQRDRALESFRRGQATVLVATDVAARGIDINGVTHVVNYDIPGSFDDYVHRIGRTGRAKESGDAITFVSPQEHKDLGVIEQGLGKNIPRTEWEGSVSVRSLYNPNGSTRSSNGGKNQKRGGGGKNFRPRRRFARAR